MGCGVKSDPIAPPGTAIPSYVNQFLDNEVKKPEVGKEKKDESDSSDGKQSGKQ